MAWNAVTDVNDGQSFGGAAWQSAIDAVTQIQTAIGPDETPNLPALVDRQFVVGVTLDDDEALSLPLGTGVVRGMLTIVGNIASSGHAMIAFRTGDPSAHATVIASGGATVTGGVGFMSGVTGPDGGLNVNVRTDSTRIHVENRTGAVKSYQVSFSAVAGTFDASAVWG